MMGLLLKRMVLCTWWFLRDRWDCLRRRCGYYDHYLAYGPADLTHAGFHAAERACTEAQRAVMRWFDEHPDDMTGRTPHDRAADYWEAKVRA